MLGPPSIFSLSFPPAGRQHFRGGWREPSQPTPLHSCVPRPAGCTSDSNARNTYSTVLVYVFVNCALYNIVQVQSTSAEHQQLESQFSHFTSDGRGVIILQSDPYCIQCNPPVISRVLPPQNFERNDCPVGQNDEGTVQQRQSSSVASSRIGT